MTSAPNPSNPIQCMGKCRARYYWNVPAEKTLATNDRCPECGGQLVLSRDYSIREFFPDDPVQGP
jgi:ferredoxin-like protein FixX